MRKSYFSRIPAMRGRFLSGEKKEEPGVFSPAQFSSFSASIQIPILSPLQIVSSGLSASSRFLPAPA